MGLTRKINPKTESSDYNTDSRTLIRKVDLNYISLPSEKRYLFDIDTQEVFESKPLFNKRNFSYYVIDFDKNIETKGLSKEISELDDSCSLNLMINYKVQILSQHPKELIKLLLDNSSDRDAINERIFQWISNFSNNEPEFVKRYFNLKDILINHIEDEARKIGLSLEIFIDVKKDGKPSTFSGWIDVKACDYHGKVPLGYEIEVSITEDKKSEGIKSLSNTTQLKKIIENIIKNTIDSKNTIDLNFLYFKLNTGLRELLLRELNVALDKYGLKPDFFCLDNKLQDLPPSREKINHKVNTCTKNNYSISVNHNLILTLVNLGNFYSLGIMDFKNWVETELERITQDYLFEKDYTELALNFDSTEIKDEMTKSVSKAGYEIKQLITIPDFRDVIPIYFDFEVGKDEEFPTHNDDVRVKLNIVVNGKIQNPESLKKYITPKANSNSIIQKMKEMVINTLRQSLHNIDPQRFYLYFETPEKNQSQSLSDELKEKIIDKLKTEFGADNLDIALKQLETDLISKFKSLQGVSHSVYFENFNKQARFECRFMITSVSENGYHLFKAKCDAFKNKNIKDILEDISRVIKHRIELELNTKSNYSESSIRSPLFLSRIMELLRTSKEIIIKEFGLIIQISEGLRRLPSYFESEVIKRLKELEESNFKIWKNQQTQKVQESDILTKYENEKTSKIIDRSIQNMECSIEDEECDTYLIEKGKALGETSQNSDATKKEDNKIDLPDSIDTIKNIAEKSDSKVEFDSDLIETTKE